MKIKLPSTFELFRAIANKVVKTDRPPERGNAKLNIGVTNEHMSNFPQIDILRTARADILKAPINYNLDEGDIDSRRGSQVIPESKDYYIGEPYGQI